MRVTDFLEKFIDPDPKFSPAPIWWWSGEKLEINRLRWQMDQLKAMGICNIVILNLAPNGALFGCEADDPGFLTEEWWAIFRQVCDHARDIGMFVWFYDQIGFSGANYQAEIVARHPEFSARKLRIVSITGQGALSVECPGAGDPIAAYSVEVGMVRSVELDGRSARATFSGEAKLNLVYSLRQGYDYFSAIACEKLLDTVHREFERRLPDHIGSTIVGSFQDELPDIPTWGSSFAETFAEQFGYRIESVIHRLFEEGDADRASLSAADSRRTRLHYHQHRANLSEEALFKPFYRWHDERSLQCGFDQQSPAREARILGCVQKYADYVQTHRWYAAPGCDLHGNGKLHSSIAWMYDRPRVWIEGFHSTGWGGTIADTFDWLLPYLQSGCNLYNPHAVYYSTRMGWWEWAPPSTCWRQPYAMHYRGFAQMVARLTKMLAQGVHEASVGVLFPNATVQSAMGPEVHFTDAKKADLALHRIIGSMRWHEAKLGMLDELAIDFHLLDEATIQASLTPSPGTLRGEEKGVRYPLSADRPHLPADSESSASKMSVPDPLSFKGVSFSTLILPHVTMLDDRTVAAIRDAAKHGLRVIAVGSPIIETPDGQSLDVRELPNARFVESVEQLAEAMREVKPKVLAPVPILHRRVDDLHVLFVPAVAGMATVVEWPSWERGLDRATIDPARYLERATIGLPEGTKQVWRFDPIDCRSEMIESKDGAVDVDFNGAPFAVLICSPDEPISNPKPEIASHAKSIALSDEWSCEYIPTLPTDFADIYPPTQPQLRLPHTSEFRWSRDACDESWANGIPESARSETVRATFGIHGWVTSDDSTEPSPLVYSPQFGIATDRIHMFTLGPKGHVTEEFIDLGKLSPGEKRTIRTGVISDSKRVVTLAIGANARKAIRIGGKRLVESGDQYFWKRSITLCEGDNPIEIELTADDQGPLRAFWFLSDGPLDNFARPERMLPPDGPVPGSRLTFRGKFESGVGIAGGQLQVAVAAVATVWIDDHLLGRQGGFDPYRLFTRGVKYELAELPKGVHEILIELIEPSNAAPLIADLMAWEVASKVTPFCFSSGADWTVSRDNGPEMPVRLCSKQEGDGAIWHLWRRPHPLPKTAWLEGEQGSAVLDLPLMPASDVPVTQWFEWTIPPGVTDIKLPLIPSADATLWVDGKPLPLSQADAKSLAARKAVLRARSRYLGGAIFEAPVFYEFAEGVIRTGSWMKQGLRSYSGAIRMSQRFHHDQIPHHATLDLGQVRGTVEARLNGTSLGVRFLSPYRFDLSNDLKPGENELELVITNTLVNFLSTWSPTRNWATDQLDCGLIGPVSIAQS